MTPSLSAPALSLDDLMTRGYFPDRVIPPVNSLAISPAISDILAYIGPRAANVLNKTKGPGLARSLCLTHSVPKRKHLRRTMSIPNPLNQSVLCNEIAAHWKDIQAFCSRSPVSLSTPQPGANRAVEATNELGKLPLHRAQRSIGARYLLRTDIARYYPSIYTHSVPWALHGKTAARVDKKYKLFGNRLDLWLRETQDKQTGGIPIGPDTSFLFGEILGTALDLELLSQIPSLRGTRYVDDYHLYFSTVADAEKALATLHEVAHKFELEINDPKTEVVELPETLEPLWKRELRSLAIRDNGQPQATDLLTLWDRAFEHAESFPADSVLTYAAKQTLSATISDENWKFCEALLLKAALAEPTMLSVLGDIYGKYVAYHTDNSALTTALESICGYHAPLQQGNEVAWALWLAKIMNVPISKAVGDKIVRLDDDVVALITLDLHQLGLLKTSGFTKWRGYLTAGNLYDSHWLLSYEAVEQGWLPSKNGNDYVGADEFFSILRKHGVRFYGAGIATAASFFGYDDEENIDSSEIDEGEMPLVLPALPES
jgi:Reverse transcriptase (RNA-dependent DNA polymerase)